MIKIPENLVNEIFYANNDCLSDDVDKEEGRIERWLEANNFEIV